MDEATGPIGDKAEGESVNEEQTPTPSAEDKLSFGISVADLDSAGGKLIGKTVPWFRINGHPVIVMGDEVESHGEGEHQNARMVQGVPWFTIGGRPVVCEGHLSSCGHPATGRSSFCIVSRDRVASGHEPPPPTPAPSGEVYLDRQDGYIKKGGLQHHIGTKLEQSPLIGPHAIILHRTDSYKAGPTIDGFRRSGIGTHFLVDENGTIHQTTSLLKYTQHIGLIKCRSGIIDEPARKAEAMEILKNWKANVNHCRKVLTKEITDVEKKLTSGTMSKKEADRRKAQCLKDADDNRKVERREFQRTYDRSISDYEKKSKKYPERYPINQESIGIETISKYDRTNKMWSNVSSRQKKSIYQLVEFLKKEFGLKSSDVYEHPTISKKTEGEGAHLLDGTQGELIFHEKDPDPIVYNISI